MGRGIFIGTLALACSEVSGLEDYSLTRGSEPVEFLKGPECTTCLESRCEPKLTACEGDELCASLLSRRRQCLDPDCHTRAVYDAGVHEVAWKQKQWATEFRELYACARDTCRAECSAGVSWGCVGRYAWALPAAGPRTLWHRVFDRGGAGIDGALVTACSRSDPYCEAPLGPSTKTFGGGFAELSVVGGDPDVYLRIDPDPTYPAISAVGAARPRQTRELSESPVESVKTLESVAAATGVGWDGSEPHVWVEVRDCNGFGGDDVVFDVWRFENGTRHPCPSCRFVYQTDNYKPDPDAEATDPDGPMAAIGGLDPGMIVVEARLRSTGRIVARTLTLLEPARVLYIVMNPLSTTEVE